MSRSHFLATPFPTGAILVVLITILGPISGAHFNPAVSLVFALKRELSTRDAVLYIIAQIIGGILGTDDRPRDVCSAAAGCLDEDPYRRSAMVCRGSSGFWPDYDNSCRHSLSTRVPCRGWSAFTSRPPIGLPPRPRSPIPPWRSRVHSPTLSRAFARSIFPASSSPNFAGLSSALLVITWLLQTTPDAKPLDPEAKL